MKGKGEDSFPYIQDAHAVVPLFVLRAVKMRKRPRERKQKSFFAEIIFPHFYFLTQIKKKTVLLVFFLMFFLKNLD